VITVDYVELLQTSSLYYRLKENCETMAGAETRKITLTQQQHHDAILRYVESHPEEFDISDLADAEIEGHILVSAGPDDLKITVLLDIEG